MEDGGAHRRGSPSRRDSGPEAVPPNGGPSKRGAPPSSGDWEQRLAQLSHAQRLPFLAPHSLGAYAEYVHGYVPPRHARVWLNVLQAAIMEETDATRVVVLDAPPGHAKSSYISEVLPTWFLGRRPEASVLHLTSTDNLAGLYHATVEQTLRVPEAGDAESRAARHQRVFPDPGCRPGAVWNFEKGLRLAGARGKVSYKMAGFGSAILGLRGNLIILDDPLTEEKASSELELAKAKRYFRRTVWTRQEPGTIVVLVATRWGYDDLTAEVLANYPNVRLIHMPALGHWLPDGTRVGDLETGEALWPEYISRERLLLELHGTGSGSEGMRLEDFLTIYQGEPGNAEGTMLTPALIQQLPDLQARDEQGAPRIRLQATAQSWDLAFTEKTTSDYTVCATLSSDGHNVYLRDLFEGRINEERFERELNDQALAGKPSIIGIESVAAQKWVVRGVERRTMLPIQAIEAGNASKEARARLLALLIEKQRFFVDKTAAYWPRLRQQFQEFPKGKHDDIVDAIAQGCHLLIASRVQHVRSRKFAHTSGATPRDETLKQRLRRRSLATAG